MVPETKCPSVGDLTARQTEVLTYLLTFKLSHGYAPSYRDISAHFGIGSTNAVASLVKPLVRKGYVWRPRAGQSKARAMKILKAPAGWHLLPGGGIVRTADVPALIERLKQEMATLAQIAVEEYRAEPAEGAPPVVRIAGGEDMNIDGEE